MAIGKIKFSNLTLDANHDYLAIGGVRFYINDTDYYDTYGSTVINDELELFETDTVKITSSDIYNDASFYRIRSPFDTTHPQTGTYGDECYTIFQLSSGQWVEVEFKNPPASIKKIEFVPLPDTSATNRSMGQTFTLEVYDESGNLIKSYSVTPDLNLPDGTGIQTFYTPELVAHFFKANSDDSYIVSIIQNQEEGDTDWVQFQASEKTKASVNIDGSSTNTTLNTPDLNRKLYKSLLYNSTDGAKIGKLKFSSQGSTYNSYQILDATLTQTPEKAHVIAQTKDLSSYINTTDTTSTQLVLENNLEDEILVREGDTLVIANDTDGILELENFSVSRSLSADGTKQVYTIDISSLSLSNAPTTVEVIKPLMDVSLSNSVGVENIPLTVDTSKTTTTEVYFDYDSLSDAKKDIVQNIQKVDLDTGLNINFAFESLNSYAGAPVEYKYFQDPYRVNELKVTSGVSGSFQTSNITFPDGNKVRLPQIFMLKNKVYVNESFQSPYNLYVADIDANGDIGPFIAHPVGPAPDSYLTILFVTNSKVFSIHRGEKKIYYIEFDEDGNITSSSWQDSGKTVPFEAYARPYLVTKTKIYVWSEPSSSYGSSHAYVADIDANGDISDFYEDTNIPTPPVDICCSAFFRTKTRFYAFPTGSDEGTVVYLPINSDGTISNQFYTQEFSALATSDKDTRFYAVATANKAYISTFTGTIVVMNIDDNGVVTGLDTTLTSDLYLNISAPFVTKNKLYYIGGDTAQNDIRYINFDGWERTQASYLAVVPPHLEVPEQSQAPTKAIIRPNLQEVIKINTEEITYDNTNDEVNIKYDKVKIPDARKIQVKWNSPIANAENSELRVDLWKKAN